LPDETVDGARLERSATVAGEGLPSWIAPAVGVLGALVAAAAAWFWLAGDRAAPGRAMSESSAVLPVMAPPQQERADESRRSGGGTGGSGASPDAASDAPGPAGAAPIAVAFETPQWISCPTAVQVAFAFDSALPEAPLPDGLVSLIVALSNHPAARLVVRGHADPVGTDQYNLLLSWRRARAVGAILERLGVPPTLLDVAAAGADGSARDPSALRRVDVGAIGIPNCPLER